MVMKENTIFINKYYTLREDSGGGRRTWVLKVTPEGWTKISHLFDDKGRPINSSIKRIGVNDKLNLGVWNLYASKIFYADGQAKYKIYGVSGDYTFGNAPMYYQQRYRGHKRAAKKVYDWFINQYFSENFK